MEYSSLLVASLRALSPSLVQVLGSAPPLRRRSIASILGFVLDRSCISFKLLTFKVDCETRARLVRLRSFPRERGALVEEFRLSVKLGKANEFIFSVAWSICGVELGTLTIGISTGGATDGV